MTTLYSSSDGMHRNRIGQSRRFGAVEPEAFALGTCISRINLALGDAPKKHENYAFSFKWSLRVQGKKAELYCR